MKIIMGGRLPRTKSTGGTRQKWVPVSACTVCSLTPPINPVRSASGQFFCFPCLHRLVIHPDHLEDRRVEDVEALVQVEPEMEPGMEPEMEVETELHETLGEQIVQLRHHEDSLEQIRTTMACALGPLSREESEWIDTIISHERNNIRQEIAWLERRRLAAQFAEHSTTKQVK